MLKEIMYHAFTQQQHDIFYFSFHFLITSYNLFAIFTAMQH